MQQEHKIYNSHWEIESEAVIHMFKSADFSQLFALPSLWGLHLPATSKITSYHISRSSIQLWSSKTQQKRNYSFLWISLEQRNYLQKSPKLFPSSQWSSLPILSQSLVGHLSQSVHRGNWNEDRFSWCTRRELLQMLNLFQTKQVGKDAGQGTAMCATSTSFENHY